ncbi:mannose-1-phosphate guanylyltransferase [Treponema berlinense]|uniref:mannose-1-phosphate guanylyltransferase n=1 Tax=Treponema berlinense TaxID=225004 RepID=UPI0026F34CF5|nr:sugar phosphate nucleotidyltransferase [Treponema berlinense]
MITDVIIMAGGFGERLWPASSPSHPKQFMALNDNISFLQESLLRALSLKISGKIIIVTRKDIEQECTLQIKRLAEHSEEPEARKLLAEAVVLSEPSPKHTSAAIMLGVSLVSKLEPDVKHTFLVLTSDHVISPVGQFVRDCRNAAAAAEDGKFVCFAIAPTHGATGYGYIKAGQDLTGEGHTFKIENFKEKPDEKTAREYFESGCYFWNSGMFSFEGKMFLNEMKTCTPKVSEAFEPVFNGKKPSLKQVNGVYVIKNWSEMELTYQQVPSIAVDKAIAEKSSNAAVVKATFKWTDVGSWDTFSELCTNPANNRVVQIESENNFVYSDIPVSLCGVKDLIVVAKNGKLLVMKKGESSLVRSAVKEMEH